MGNHEDDKPTVDELGEALRDILRQSREQNMALSRLGQRIEDIHRRIMASPFPILPKTSDEQRGDNR